MALSARGPSRAASLVGAGSATARVGTPRSSTPRAAARNAWLTPRDGASDRSGGAETPRSATKEAYGSSLKAAANTALLNGTQFAAVSARNTNSNGFRLGVHVAPDVQRAGKAVDIDLFARGLQPDVVVPTPNTPPSYGDMERRHRRRKGPGDHSIHWGLSDVRPPDPGDGYGIKSRKDEHVAEVFASGQQFGIQEYLNSCGESIYRTTRTEPLGKSYLRGHKLPQQVHDATFEGFGMATTKDLPAKEAIFPRGVDPDSKEVTGLYRKTHGSFLPGEMVNRDYVWPGSVGNEHFRFGHNDDSELGTRGTGVKNALGGESFGKTRITKCTAEYYRQVADDQLGTTKNLMQTKQDVAAGHTYGIPSGKDPTSAGQLMQGFYSEAEQMPDYDLGKCTAQGRRNLVTDRHLGVPTVRTDLVAKPSELRSITNSTNFGDDPSAYGLIYPNKFQFQGVSDKDFQARRSLADLQSLFEGAGQRVDPEDFRMLFETAIELQGDGQELVSLELLMQMYAHWMAGGTFS